MSHILITSGPTRQYLDPVRYLTNGSSGRMGQALAIAGLEAGHSIVVITGPVPVEYPPAAEVIRVTTTEEMLDRSLEHFPTCDGVIGAAAPCDYRPERVESHKIKKTGQPVTLHLQETPDIIATLGARKQRQWIIGFALETEDARFQALTKLERKCCDWMVLNHPSAMESADNHVEILDATGHVMATIADSKLNVARRIFELVEKSFPPRSLETDARLDQ